LPAWIKTLVFASLVFLPQILVADTQKEVIDKLEKFEQKNISNLDPWDVAHFFGLTKVRRPSDWTSSKLLSLPVPKSDKQMSCLAEALYFEARGEPIEGQLAVGEVILNRVEDTRYPSSICKVVNQGTGRRFACQFTYTCDGKLETVHERKPYEMALKIAKILLTTHERKLTRGSTHYHSNYVNPKWSKKFERVAKFGRHIFYRQPILLSQR
jgi:spore germination cell wall hydrolase CwlJ-like protein